MTDNQQHKSKGLPKGGEGTIGPVGSDFVFIYWDDLGDSQEHVDNQNNDNTT